MPSASPRRPRSTAPPAPRAKRRCGRAISAACAGKRDLRAALPAGARPSALWRQGGRSRRAASPGCRIIQSSISALPGPVSKASRLSSSPMKVTFATPPIFIDDRRARQRRILAPARDDRPETNGAPSPALGHVLGAEIITTSMPVRSASSWPSPSWTVSRVFGAVQHRLAVEADDADLLARPTRCR